MIVRRAKGRARMAATGRPARSTADQHGRAARGSAWPRRSRHRKTFCAPGGLTTEQIAVAVGTSPAAVRQRLVRARQRLRALLDATADDDPVPRTVDAGR
jgi:hypothetical protein